jgi:hypothetical protein
MRFTTHSMHGRKKYITAGRVDGKLLKIQLCFHLQCQVVKKSRGLLDPENEESTLLRNIDKYLLVDTE